MNSFLRKSGIFAFVFVLANLFFSGSAFGQTITTDAADYPPGGTVTISGSGFQAAETVTLQVLHVDANGDNLSSPTGAHAPWTVEADANGDVSSTWLVPSDEDEIGATLLLTADGYISGIHTEVTFADSDPTAQVLPYSQNFNGFSGSTTTYPAGLQGWTITGSLSTSYSTATNASDQTLVAGTAATTSAGVYDMNGKIGIESTGSSLKGIGLAISTIGKANIIVSWDAMTIRTENTRLNGLGMQYRIGITGAFTDIPLSEYQNQMSPTQTAGTTGLNVINKSVTLPSICENQSVVQLRWVIRDISGSGNRPSFAIDNISITVPVPPSVDYANLQFPATASITPVGSVTVFAQTYEPGVTEAAGAGSGISAWIGYSSTNVDPSGATFTWIPATFNTQVGNNDEWKANLGSLPPGTYYYASRFQLNGGPFKYGGYNSGFWNGTTNVNGVLTVTDPTVDFANVQFPNTATITTGGSVNVFARVFESGVTPNAGADAGITAWVGYSSANVNPSDALFTWVPATFNVQVGNDDEYQATIGPLLQGTYYYASRFQLNGGSYSYGGLGNFWNSSTNPSGVLTVTCFTATPTGSANQSFNNSANVGNLVANGTNVQWFETASSTTPLSNSTALVNGNHYFASSTINGCESARLDVTVTIVLTQVDFANLQYPATATINTGGSVTAYARVYEPGVTPNAGSDAGISAWIGYSSSNVAPNDPSFTWVPATFNVQVGNDDEYQATIGSTLPPGTYYYASRFQLTGGPYSYGGLGNFWNASSNPSGVLTVNCTPPTAPTISASGTTTFCTGGSVVLTSSSSIGNLWSNGETTQSITVATSGTYSVSTTVSLGCTSASSDPVIVTVNPIPSTPTIAANGSTTFCQGGSVTLTSSNATGNLWSTGETTQSIVASTSGSYTVKTTINGCDSAASAPTVVTVNSFSSTAIVLNENFGTTSSLPSGWSVTGSTTWTNSTGVTSSGDYATASGGGNMLADNNSSTDASLVSPTINFSGSINGVLTFGMRRSSASFTRSIAVEASTDNGANFTAFTQTIPASSINSGSYSLQTINLGSSINNASQVKLRFRFVGTAGSSGPNVRIDDVIVSGYVAGAVTVSKVDNCGGTATLTASSGSSYLWTRPDNTTATTQSLTINTSGSYSVTVTSANGCSATNTANYTVIPALTATVSSKTDLTCNGVSTGSITVAASNGTAPYSYTIAGTTVNTTGATSGTFTGLAAGTTYVVTVKDANNCTVATGNSTISQPSAIVASAVVTAPLCFGGNGTVVVSATGGFGTLTGTGSNTVAAGQAYSFAVTDTNGCSSNTISGTMANPVAVPPTVVTQNLTVNLDASGNGTITAAQIDNGSSDACGPITMAVNPSTFNCGNIRPVMSDLIISEYVEGSSNIKYLEIYNGTAATVNLANYTLRNYTNGSSTVSSFSNLPTATLATGSTVVYMNSSASGYSGPATPLSVMTFNGDDAVALFNNSTSQFADIIGQIGTDPGTEWGSGVTSTADNTLRRKSYISSGDTNGSNAFVPATEWDGFATDDVSGLGSHNYTGGNLVVLTVTNTANNISATGTAIVTVKDNMAPVTPTLNDVTVGECNGTPIAPTTSDNCKGTITGTTSTVFPITTQGTTVVTWTFSDGNGNSTTANQNVIVKDVTAPVANLAALPTITGQCSATIASAPTATDTCSGTITGTTTDALTRSTQGTSTVHWTFDDGNGNKSYQTQDIVVTDTQAPVVDAASLASATGQCLATITSAPTATDNCSGTITGTTTDSLTRSTQGTSTVTWTFDDGNGNKSYQTQDIVVDDTIAPVADVATLPTVTGECSASVSVPTATDACVGSITGTTTDPISYSAQGTYTVTWTYDDGNGNTSSQTQTVIVDDVTAPITPSLADVTGECSATALTATTSDVCVGSIIGTTSDALSYSTQGTYIIHWTFDDGNGNTTTANQNVIIKDVTVPTITAAANVSVANATGACSAEVSLVAPTTGDNCEMQSVANDHPSTTYPVGTTTVTWTVTDVGGNTATATQTVTVINAAPVINSITPSTVSPVAISTGVSVAVNYTDNNVTSGKVNWDDGLGDQTISASLANPFTLNHTYTTPGVYTVTITLTDACGSTGSSKYDYIVVYDPNGGFVTGGGWINSPTGAYPADVLLSGKANFGFVAKYKKGTNLVDGNTEFQFHAGNFKFNSTTNDAGTLVISGAKASYRGVGTVNGTGNYGYLVSAIDGQVTGGGGTDKFRIKIWDKNNGNAVVYDNQMSAAENADANTLIAGGSIVIHEVKKTNAKIIDIPTEPIPFNVIAYPNPAKYQFTLVVEGGNKEKIDVLLYDVLGRTLKHIESSDGQPIQFGEELPTGAYFTIVSQGASQKTLRLIKE